MTFLCCIIFLFALRKDWSDMIAQYILIRVDCGPWKPYDNKRFGKFFCCVLLWNGLFLLTETTKKKKTTNTHHNLKKTLEKSTALYSLVAVLQQSGPLHVPDKTNCTTTVAPVLQRQNIVESQILVRRRRIFSHKVFVVLLAVVPSFRNHTHVEWSWELNVQRLQYT